DLLEAEVQDLLSGQTTVAAWLEERTAAGAGAEVRGEARLARAQLLERRVRPSAERAPEGVDRHLDHRDLDPQHALHLVGAAVGGAAIGVDQGQGGRLVEPGRAEGVLAVVVDRSFRPGVDVRELT